MKKITINLITIFALSVLINCANDTAEQSQKTKSPEKITLINGEKWVVNKEMTPHIHDMEKTMTSFNGSSAKDFQALGITLKVSLDKLISSCTMNGQSHDELHVWLMPYMKAVNNLIKTKDAKEGKELYKEIKNSLETYNQNFQ